ncbi:hypothetical protein [Streptomyces sp. NPDC090036]|uniref:hypothetical protein n=1 Tax=Streptomyces sp. NPDC090036 TaxID=3365926 RepID=UPI0037FAE037
MSDHGAVLDPAGNEVRGVKGCADPRADPFGCFARRDGAGSASLVQVTHPDGPDLARLGRTGQLCSAHAKFMTARFWYPSGSWLPSEPC